MASVHIPVLGPQIVEWLAVRPGGCFVDGTFGGGGHSRLIAEAMQGEGHLIGVDRDPGPIEAAPEQLAGLRLTAVHASYSELATILRELELPAVDGIVLDLGLSSDQLADDTRGFSFDSEGDLDLRFDPTEGEPAWKLIERLNESTLADLIYELGEERLSRQIAKRIVGQRRETPIRSARQLADIVRGCVTHNQRKGKTRPERIDPATRTFQALRIAVNRELKILDEALRNLPETLAPGGRLAIISFHSLEDRRVKEAFRDDPRLSVLTRKPVRPDDSEVERNRRSRSSRLRVAERVGSSEA